MYTSWRTWLRTACIAIGLFVSAHSAQATTINDPSITSAALSSISSTTPAATGVQLQFTFTTSQTIAAAAGFYIEARSVDCQLPDYSFCQMNFNSATASGITGSVGSSGSQTSLYFVNTNAMPAGTYSLTVSNVVNMNYNGGVRFFFSNPASDWSSLDEYETFGTKTDATVIGTPLAYGTVLDPDGAAVSLYGNAYSEDWSINQGFSSDQWGFYTVLNPGFSAGQTVFVSAYPDSSTGLATTSSQFTASSSSTLHNITLVAASKTIFGTVTYEDTGAAVTTAMINAGKPGVWVSDGTDSAGAYSLKLSGGAYEVCIGDLYDEETGQPVEKDWYYNEGCESVTFADDNSSESATVNFVVGRADARIEGIFLNPDGSAPSQGGWVSFWNNEGWFGGNVSSETGAFSVAVVGGNSSSIQSTSLYVRSVDETTYQVGYSPSSSEEHTYWDEDSVTVGAGETLDLGTITLGERDVVANVTVQNEAGVAVEGIYVDAWQENGGWTNAQTNSQGIATLYLYEGDWNLWPSLWDRDDYLYAGEPGKISVASGDTVSYTFELTATTLTVNVTVETSDGIFTPINGWANCWSFSGTGFGGSVQNGTGSFGAIGGSYSCNLWVDSDDYMTTQEIAATFTDGQDASLDFVVAERSAELTVYVKDDDNNLVSDAPGRVYAHTETGGWVEERLSSDGTALLRLAPGTYYVGVWFEDGASYISSLGYQAPIVLEENDSETKTLTVFAVSGELIATVQDSAGNPIGNAWVWCGNWHELEDQAAGDFDGGRFIESGSQTGADGIAVVGLVEGHEYNCGASVPPQYEFISPQSQDISLLTEDSVSTTFEFLDASATIAGSASIDEGGDISRLWCGAWADEGYNSWTESRGSEYELNAVPGTWHLWCGTDVTVDGEAKFYSTNQDLTVVVSEEGQVVSQNVTLTESFWNIPESVSVSFDSTQAYTLILEDGTTVNFPANSLASSGNVTVTAEPDLGAIRTTDIPFGFPWNFEAYDADGELISGNFNSTVTLRIPYDEAILEEFGLSAEDLLPKVYNTDTGAWEIADNVSLNEEAAEIVFTLAHFSKVGLTYNVNAVGESTKPGIPRALKAKKITKHSARLQWKKPKDSQVKKYQLQLRACEKNTAKACRSKKNYEGKKQWDTFKKIPKQAKRVVKRKVIKKLEVGTFYQFHVRACNATQCGNWSKWERFKTKK